MKRTIFEPQIAEIEIEHSKFIARIFHIENEEEVKPILKEVSKKEHKAEHNCYAYVLNENKYKSNDDGEPASSAGMPILEMIKGNKLENVLVIVTRYFGGIKLGVGGLIRAYGGATKEVINKSKIVEIASLPHYELTLDYSLNDILDSYCKKNNIVILNKEFNELVKYTIYLDNENKINELKEYMQNKISISFLGCKEIKL